MADYVICGRCKADLAAVPAEEPCPHCGNAVGARIIGVSYVEKLVLRDYAGFKHRRPGRKRLAAEGYTREEESRDGSGRRVKITRWIDRDRDPPWYFEKVEDMATGEVLRECSEPLADHVGRGDARKDKDKSGE